MYISLVSLQYIMLEIMIARDGFNLCCPLQQQYYISFLNMCPFGQKWWSYPTKSNLYLSPCTLPLLPQLTAQWIRLFLVTWKSSFQWLKPVESTSSLLSTKFFSPCPSYLLLYVSFSLAWAPQCSLPLSTLISSLVLCNLVSICFWALVGSYHLI